MIKTPITNPNHPTVGRYFMGSEGIYYCDSYDTSLGYWLTNILNANDRRNVSERAIDRTFHTIHFDDGKPYSRWRNLTEQELKAVEYFKMMVPA